MDARPERVMMWVAENIQACLRIFRRAQHQWPVRDIVHQAQGVFYVFVLWPLPTGLIRPIRLIRGRKRRTYPLAYCPPGSICDMLSIPRALPPVTHSSALQAPECMWGIIRGRTIHRTGVYSCLSPCDGCKTRKGDDGAGRKYSSLLEDFQTGTASMARKRHLASSARGF